MPSTAEQIKQARATKLSENQAHRAAKRNRAKTVVVVEARVLSHKEKEVGDAVVTELVHVATVKGDVHADLLAQSTKYWMDWAYHRFPNHALDRFASAEAARWYEARHPRPARPARREHF